MTRVTRVNSAGVVRSTLPSFVTHRDRPNSYNSVFNVYNAKPTNTRKLRASLGLAKAGTTPVHHAFLGDSLTAGYMGSTASPVYEPTKAWPVLYRNTLAALGIPTGGTGFVPFSDVTQVAADSRWTTTGTWTSTGAGYAGTTTSGATATFISDIAGPTAELYFYGGGGAATWTVDGVSQGSLDMTGGIVIKRAAATSLSNAVHTIVVTTSNTTIRYIVGASVTGSSGLIVHNLGEGSSQTATWTSTAAGTLNNARCGSLGLSSITPSVVYLALGVNDVLNSIAVSTFKTNMTTLRNQFSTSDVVLVGQPCWANFADETFDLADTLDVPFIDLYSRYGGTANGSPAQVNGLVSDGSFIHVNQACHADWGRNASMLAAA